VQYFRRVFLHKGQITSIISNQLLFTSFIIHSWQIRWLSEQGVKYNRISLVYKLSRFSRQMQQALLKLAYLKKSIELLSLARNSEFTIYTPSPQVAFTIFRGVFGNSCIPMKSLVSFIYFFIRKLKLNLLNESKKMFSLVSSWDFSWPEFPKKTA
jgi:hypothetical protein